MNIRNVILQTGIVVLGVSLSWAEDVRATIAALDDPVAECRYLAQKVETQNRALTIVRELTDLYVEALNKTLTLPQGSTTREEQSKRTRLIEQKKGEAIDISLEADTEVLAVEEAIRARRGSLDQCKEGVVEVPPPKGESVPTE